ncbi:MAG: flagellar biosynthesis protein FlhF [Hydrogenophilales bacterium 16-64-46]|nr:MAG: flagellar biosynthesis protein FlhF [Hydrogenophilales bacterium 12-64-13]OYZ04953.1 MAG: flagellar biosynthesis protein FlhF [Hydrogenophilales bacterium 16-64-46]OZA37597.1 MAG: flagellar biosynthesis protein FlhF [Hydrogenophilales bacterium 17-64-34]HQT00867.1 flagellar biosynthesis protein FlhF [Thiobacillus sp.]
MSVRVFVAANAREGLARVRSELGDAAVVLATRPHPQGVEILASAYAELASPGRNEALEPAGSRILNELARLRGMLQNQLAGFAWSAGRRRDPARVAILQTLFAAGFGGSLARTLAARLPRGLEGEAAQRWLRQVLIRNVPVVGMGTEPVATGGSFALVGSTGSGKTTTLAKLAARAVELHGAGKVALVAADAYRIGAEAQLRVYAELLGVGLHAARDTEALARLLPKLATHRLILVDTAGFAPADARALATQQLDTLGVRRLLVVAAGQQGAAIEQAFVRFGQGAAGCILGKLDEAPQPGAALDSLIRHRLPLAYVTSGQRVPEDLHRPNAVYLVDRALRGGQLATPFALSPEDWPLVAGVEAERSLSSESGPSATSRHAG